VGGSKKQTIGYRYYLGMHFILCHGPIDSISRIRIEKKTAWIGFNTGGSITIDKPTMFGGDEKEGGIQGTIDIEMGAASQVQNSYLTSVLGAIIPAYRGLVGVVFRRPYLGNSSYLKSWSFRGTRIQKTSEGGVQWYPEKASIEVDTPASPTLVSSTDPWQLAYGSSFEFLFGPPNSPKDSGYAAASPGPFARTGTPGTLLSSSYGYWIKRTVTVENESLLRIYGGVENSCAVYFDNVKVLDDNPLNTQVLGDSFSVEVYASEGEHTIHICFRDEFPINSDNASLSVTVDLVSTAQVDMNGVHIIRELLTDKTWGMGYTSGDIDDTNFRAAADVIYDEKLGISLIWDRSMDIEAFVKEVARHIDASVFVSRKTGKYDIKLIRNDYDPDDLISLNPSNIASVSNPNRVAFGELSNSVTVKFWNYKTSTDDSVTVTDTALARIQQDQLINASVNYPGFTNKRNAIIAAQRDLRVLSAGLFSCTIICDDTAKDLNIGSPFKFTWPEWEIYDMVMRVTGISFGDGINNKIRITASEDVYSTSTNPQVTDGGTSWVDPSKPPGAIQYQMAEEVPYFEAVQNYGQTTVDDLLATNENIGYVLAAAGRPDGAINARMWTDSGAGYQEASLFDLCPFGLTSASLDPTTDIMTLTSFSDLDQVTVGSFAQIGTGATSEIIRIDIIDETTGMITVGRGCLDTTPKRYLTAGQPVFFWDAYAGIDQTEYASGETVNVKVTSITGQGEFDVETASLIPVTLNQRAFKAYPPGNLLINAESYPIEFSLHGSLDISWVGRDRLQQTSGEIYDHFFGNIGPEAGVTYRFRGYIDNVLITTVEPATSGYDWVPMGYEGLARIEIHSVRDGLYSFQPAMHEFAYTNSRVKRIEDGDKIETPETSGLLRLRED
jgi:hypothetical protein